MLFFLLVVLLLYIETVRTQIPYLKESESATFGQCKTNTECSIYTQLYPSQSASFFVCNTQIGRCSTIYGDVLDPAFNALCPGISITSIAFPSLTASGDLVDGMLVFNITAPGYISGVFRLYTGTRSNSTSNTTVTEQFVEEKAVNFPHNIFHFRMLAPGAYTLRFFDKSGCIVTHYPPLITQAFNGTYLPINTTNPSNAAGFIRADAVWGPMRTPISAGWGRGVRAGLNSSVWAAYIQTTSGIGQRVPYAHIYDLSGGLIYTAWGTGVLWNAPSSASFSGLASIGASDASFPLGGVNFPLRADNISTIIGSQVEAMQLSGFGSMVFGIGYAYRDCSNCSVQFIQNYNGDFEGAMWPVMVFNLSTTTYMNGTVGNYDVSPQHYTLNGIYTNTIFMYSDQNFFANTTQLRILPRIVILHTGTNQTVSVNSLCINGTVSSVTVYLDYTGFPFSGNPLTFDIYRLEMNGGAGIPLVVDNPSAQQVIVAMPVATEIFAPGFYCAVLRGNLLDGRGFRPLIQSCFQIGVAEAPLTQVTSRVVPLEDVHYPYTSYAGLYPNISSEFIVGLPTTMVVPLNVVPLVIITRFSPNSDMDQQLEEFGGRNIEVFNDVFGSIDLSRYYRVANLGSFYIYTLNVNVFARRHHFNASFMPAATVSSEVAYSKLLMLATGEVPLTRPPPGRRAPTGPGRRLLSATPSQSPSPSPSQSPVPFVPPDYSEGDGAASIDLDASVTLQYMCTLPTYVNMIEYEQLVAAIIVSRGICPADRSIMSVATRGGHPFAMDTPAFSNPTYQPPGQGSSSHPFTNPVAYFNTFTNVAANKILASGVGRNRFETPQNVLIRLESIDATGARSYAYAIAVSLVPENHQIITFLPQRPVCRGGVQFVEMSFYLSNNSPNNIITVAPYDGKKTELYDPNVITFDVPANCTLLQWFNEYEVYSICVTGTIVNATALAQCSGCANLPIAYAKAPSLRAGSSDPYVITTAAANEWWLVTVWTLTEYFNNETQRFIYCQTQNSIVSLIPRPLTLTFQTPQRITGPPMCLGPDCFRVKIIPRIDPCYASQAPNPENACFQGVDYSGTAVIISDPNMEYLGSEFYRITINQYYNLTYFIANSFCPVSSGYIPTIRGPFISLIRSYRSNCNNNDGSVAIYASYTDPTFLSQALPTPVCLYWPNRHGPSFQVSDAVPLAFSLTVNAPTSTLLPNNDFVETQRFAGIRAGTHELMIYDRCPDSTCTSCLIPSSFQLTNPTLTFAYQSFTVSNFEDPAGGIVIERTDYDPPVCFGDSAEFNFTFYDNANSVTGLPTQRYEVIFFDPFNLGIRVRYAGCLPGDPQLPPPTAFGDTQVKWGPFPVSVPSGGNQGLGISGNYTFYVRGCTSGCVETFSTYIEMPQPIVIELSTAGTDCSYRPAQLVPQVSGPRGFGPNDNVTLTHVYPGSGLVHYTPYIYSWLTPLNPNVYVTQMLQLNVVPGNYTLRACGPGNCCGYKSVVVPSASAIQCTVVGYNRVCETSNATTVYINCTGGIPPYRVMENVTQVSSNTTINTEFVSGFNTTGCYRVIDSSNCIKPTEICFTVPNPGPVNISVVKRDSCPNVATGSISVTAAEPIQCSWIVTGGTQPLISSCTLTQLPITASIVVTATTIIGCSAQQVVQIDSRPPLIVSIVDRTKFGVLDGPCVDNITAVVSGGLTGPPYSISLYNDATNATIMVEYVNITTNFTSGNTTYFNQTNAAYVTVIGACRSYIYTILAIENDGICANTAISYDPEFSFGSGGPGTGIMGLGPPEGFSKPVNPNVKPPDHSSNVDWSVIASMIAGLWILFLFIAVMFTK